MRVAVGGANHEPFARSMLRADVFAGLPQFESDRGDGIAPGPEVFTRGIPFPCRTAGQSQWHFFPLRYPISEANGYFGGIAMHMCTWFWHQMPLENPRAHTICLIRGGLERVPNPFLRWSSNAPQNHPHRRLGLALPSHS
jgi:hypothetical protein